jgi:hypothetical protein
MGLAMRPKALRYHQLTQLIAERKPASIVEVGVHRAIRAEAMCLEALRHRADVTYFGFDVFEHEDEKFHADALNGKGIPAESVARGKLSALSAAYMKFNYRLFVGDTRVTLHNDPIKADFAFIDGDHRAEVIRGDYAALAESGCIVFDDYYTAGPRGELPDLSKFGANAIVDALADTHNVEILPVKDPCNHGAFTQLAVVTR